MIRPAARSGWRRRGKSVQRSRGRWFSTTTSVGRPIRRCSVHLGDRRRGDGLAGSGITLVGQAQIPSTNRAVISSGSAGGTQSRVTRTLPRSSSGRRHRGSRAISWPALRRVGPKVFERLIANLVRRHRAFVGRRRCSASLACGRERSWPTPAGNWPDRSRAGRNRGAGAFGACGAGHVEPGRAALSRYCAHRRTFYGSPLRIEFGERMLRHMTPAFQYADVRGARLATTPRDRLAPVVWSARDGLSGYTQENAGQFGGAVSREHRLIPPRRTGHGRSSSGVDRWVRLARLGADLLALVDAVVPPVGSAPSVRSARQWGFATIFAALSRPERFRRLVLTTVPTFWETRPAANGMRLGSAQLVQDKGWPPWSHSRWTNPPRRRWQTRGGSSPVCVARVAVARGVPRLGANRFSAARGDRAPGLRRFWSRSWTGDATHPVSSGETLAGALPNAELVVASTPADPRDLGRRAAAFLR